MEINKLKVLVSYHKPSTLIKNDIFIPIHVGRALKYKESKDGKICLDDYNWLIDNMIGDDTGDNISYKNREYCELTAIYWAWKNYEKLGNPEYIGFMHYRRLLNLNINKKINDIVEFNELISDLIGFSKNNIDILLSNYDIILPEICEVHPYGLPNFIMSNYDFYSRNNIIEDLSKIIKIIDNDYKDYIDDMNSYLNSSKSFFFNIFIMKKEIFFEYCEWLFGILYKYELIRGNRKNIDIDQNREIAYIAERLLNVFIKYYIRKKNDSRVIYNNIVNVCEKIDKLDLNKIILGNKDLSKIKIQKVNDNADQIYIVYSTDDNYSQHCCVSMASILLNSDKDSYFNFIILDGGITEKNKSKLLFLKNIKECNITFYDMSQFDFSRFKLNRENISEATYYRLILTQLLPNNINKIIYIDCDTIIEANIKKLWDINIENYSALVVDDECGISQCRRLALPIKNRYFNAGVLVFNLENLKKFDFYNECIKCYNNDEDIITLQDQDILNIVLNNKCKFIDLNWNTNSRIYLGNNLKGYNVPYYENSYSRKDEENAKYNPYILHYTDILKPWDIYCNHPLKNEYFDYLKFTKFKLFRIKYLFNKYIFFYKKTNNFIKFRIFSINIIIKYKK